MPLSLVARPVEMGEMGENDVQTEHRSGVDRRSGIDAKFWISFSAVLLTLFLAVLTYISAQLSDIKAGVQTLSVSSATQSEKIRQLEDRVVELNNERRYLESRVIVLEKAITRIEAAK